MKQHADVAVVGAGILGLAHAWAAARRGRSVVLFERDARAQSASIRNFGMVWPIGQTAGRLHQLALRSRASWLELAASAQVWVDPCGSLHLAHAPDEQAVLEEFVARAPSLGFDCQFLSPAETQRRCPAVNLDQLRCALWSPTELCVDPRQAIGRIPRWLHERFGVQLLFGTVVRDINLPTLHTTSGQVWTVRQAIVCSGMDFQTLYPDIYANAGIRRCKLQMMRTIPQSNGWRLGTHLASGLTLCHYPTFQVCPTLTALRQRLASEFPEYLKLGIHVMASQNHLGEVVIGDSHEYDEAIEPFDKTEIDDLIITYLRRMVHLPEWTLAARWHGLYPKHPSLPLFVAEPQPGVMIFNAPGGSGMTMSFGYAEEWWERHFGPAPQPG